MEFFSGENMVSLLTLTFLEVVLGIDNVVFVSIVSNRLPAGQQKKAQFMGITLALVGRISLLLAVAWLIGLSKPFVTIQGFDLSYRDLILIAGGLFLVWKSTSEIHARIEGTGHSKKIKEVTFRSAIAQIILLDLVFSLDSIITAVGLSTHMPTIITAIVISMGIMLSFMTGINNFINSHPAMKILAISFLFMIGTVLIVEGLHVHVPKGYIYTSMAFAMGVELLQMWAHRKSSAQKADVKK